MEDIGTRVVQPGFVASGQVIKGPLGLTQSKESMSATGLQNFSPARDFHQAAVAKTSVFIF